MSAIQQGAGAARAGGPAVTELVTADGAGQVRRWPLPDRDDDDVTVGRDPWCDVPLTGDDLVSRHHAVLRRTGGRWTVRDAGSRNGTTLDGRPVVDPVPLRPDARIAVGRTVLTFRTAPAAGGGSLPQPPAAPSPPTPPAAPTGRVGLTKVLLVAAVVESVGLVGNAVTTFVTDSVTGSLRWVVPPVVAVLAAVVKALADALGKRSGPVTAPAPVGGGTGPGGTGPGSWTGPSTTPAVRRRHGTPALAAVLVVLLVAGVGGVTLAAGVRFVTGYVSGKETGVDRLVEPVAGRTGAVVLAVEAVRSTRHFTRVDVAVRNGGDAAVTLPLFTNCTLTADDGTTLQADSFRSQFSESVPPGALQRGTLTFPGHLPDGEVRARLSFGILFGGGLGGRALVVPGIVLSPTG